MQSTCMDRVKDLRKRVNDKQEHRVYLLGPGRMLFASINIVCQVSLRTGNCNCTCYIDGHWVTRATFLQLKLDLFLPPVDAWPRKPAWCRTRRIYNPDTLKMDHWQLFRCMPLALKIIPNFQPNCCRLLDKMYYKTIGVCFQCLEARGGWRRLRPNGIPRHHHVQVGLAVSTAKSWS